MDNTMTQSLMKADPQFQENDFLMWCRDVILDIQQAWSDKHIEQLEVYETEELFLKHKEQLKNMAKQQVQDVVKDMEVKEINIVQYRRKDDFDYIEVCVDMTLINYYISLQSQEILQGSQKKKRSVRYKVVFVKEASVVSEGFQILKNITVCPYCGAPVNLSQTTHCDYCQRDIHPQESCYKVDELEIISLI